MILGREVSSDANTPSELKQDSLASEARSIGLLATRASQLNIELFIQLRDRRRDDVILLYRGATTARKLFLINRELQWVQFDIDAIKKESERLTLHRRVIPRILTGKIPLKLQSWPWSVSRDVMRLNGPKTIESSPRILCPIQKIGRRC
jgi:hypothetical protein